MPADAWLTTDDQPGDIVCCRVFCPENYLFAMYGALELLTQIENWEQVGTATPEVVAAAFLDAFLQTLEGGNCA